MANGQFVCREWERKPLVVNSCLSLKCEKVKSPLVHHRTIVWARRSGCLCGLVHFGKQITSSDITEAQSSGGNCNLNQNLQFTIGESPITKNSVLKTQKEQFQP